MKLITAYIKPERLTAVKQELFKKEIFKMSITNALGCGQQKGYMEAYRGVVQEVNLHKKVRMEIAVNDEFVDQTIDAIIAGARTGTIGDGKIFVGLAFALSHNYVEAIVAQVTCLTWALHTVTQHCDGFVLQNFACLFQGEFLAGYNFFYNTAKVQLCHIIKKFSESVAERMGVCS